MSMCLTQLFSLLISKPGFYDGKGWSAGQKNMIESHYLRTQRHLTSTVAVSHDSLRSMQLPSICSLHCSPCCNMWMPLPSK